MAQARKYIYRMPRYAQQYELPEATIRKWATKGYSLDNPSALLKEVMAQKSPVRADLSGIRKFAGMKRLPALNPRKPAEPSPPPSPPSPPSPPRVTDVADEPEEPREPPPSSTQVDALEGFQRELHRLETECDKAYKAYERQTDAGIKRELWQTWKQMLDALGKLAKIAPNAEREAGALLRVVDVEATWSRTFLEMRTELEAIPRRLSLRSELRAVDPVTIEQVVAAEIHKVMTIFHRGGSYANGEG